MTSRRTGRLLVHHYGDTAGSPLVVLHGITDSGACWGDLVERLGATYHVVAPDALGHGGSDRFTPEELASAYPSEAMYDAAAVVLREVGPALVLGHSMGGRTAAALAAREPELVTGVVLEDPAWFDTSPWGQDDRVASQRAAEALVDAADQEGAIRRCRAEHPTWPDSELGPWARAKADSDVAFLRTSSLALRQTWQETAAAIGVPALVVTGDGAVILGPSTRAEIAALGNPHLEIAVVPGADHCVRRDRGDAFHAVVDPWLAAHTSRD